MQQVAIICNMPCLTTVAAYFGSLSRSIPNRSISFRGRWRWVFTRQIHNVLVRGKGAKKVHGINQLHVSTRHFKMHLLHSDLISIDRHKPAQQSTNDNNIISVSRSCNSDDLVQIFLKILLALLALHQLHIASARIHTVALRQEQNCLLIITRPSIINSIKCRSFQNR